MSSHVNAASILFHALFLQTCLELKIPSGGSTLECIVKKDRADETGNYVIIYSGCADENHIILCSSYYAAHSRSTLIYEAACLKI